MFKILFKEPLAIELGIEKYVGWYMDREVRIEPIKMF